MLSQKIYQRKQDLLNEMVNDIIELLDEKGGKVEFDSPWDDESENTVVAASVENGIHFLDMGDQETYYPLEQLGFDDGIYLLTLLES